jgi:hypothetical protein
MLPILGAMMGFAGNMSNLAGKAWENIETNRRFKLGAEQAVGSAKAAQAASGIETIGGASPGAQIFLETMDREFKTQMDMMKRGQQMAQIGGLVGAAGTLGGSVASTGFQMADLNKSGSTFTPSTSKVPSFTLQQSDFIKGALSSGPTWK